MDFDELYKSLVPTKEAILQQVDEYTLYCFYSRIEDLQLNRAYNCPYRTDVFPSFSIFKTKYDPSVEYYWKDSATGESGNVFKLIQRIENLKNYEEVFQKINEDFGLNYNLPVLEQREKIKLYDSPKESLIKIRVSETPLTEAGINFWKQFEINQDLLDFYKTAQIKYYWSYNEQQEPYTVPDPTFAYRVGNYYQIYSPFAPKMYKWRNDLPDNYFFGYLQLPKTGNILIIDKSPKDVIFCKRLGYNAVAPKSETTLLPHKKVLELTDRFEKIYISLDPDYAGITATEKYLKLYPNLIPIKLPYEKDKTDLCKKVGFNEAKRIINGLFI